jgi:hypothetical protein
MIRRDRWKLGPQDQQFILTALVRCRAEIGYHRRIDRSDTLCFVDVSDPHVLVPFGLTQRRAMERFHVRTGAGALLSGAAAFVEVWA